MYRILNESRRDDMLLPYVNLLREKGINTNVSQLKQFLLKKFVNEGLMRNLSLGSNFYLAGVARYYFNGDLTTNKVLNVFDESQTDEFKQDICERLNACILVLRNAHIDSVGTSFEQPEDFGELKLMALLRKYNAKINQVLGIVPDKKKEGKKKVVLDENPSVGNGYTFDIIYSYEDARKYNKFTEPDAWCITYGEQHYNGYVRRLGIHYVIFRQDGYESVPRKMGPNFTKKKPHDEYGNSLIALLQSNSNGEPTYITSRWNHGSYRDGSQGTEADHAYTKEEFCRITGVNDADLQRIFKIWKDNREIKKRENAGNSSLTRKKNLDALRYVKYGQMRMNGGEDVRNVFKGVRAHFLSGKRDGTIKKCICVLVIPIWGDAETPESHVTILCDQGKMVFETFKLHTDYFWGTDRIYISPENKNDWRSDRFKDVILIHHDNYHQIYSTRFHKLIDIQGTTKFKYISDGPASWAKEKCCYYEVAMSNNQRAFIDYHTNKPLRLPNGEFWFEDWTSCDISCGGHSREVRMKEITMKQCYLSILYDSAANMRFYLDLSTKRFFTPEEFEGYRISSYCQDAVFDDVYMLRYDSDNRSFYQLYKQGKPYHILGSDKYRNINRVARYSSDGKLTILNLVTLDGECKIYDYSQDKELEFYDYAGQKVAFEYISSTGNEGADMGLIWIKLSNFRYDHCALYDLKEQRFLLNPYSKSYIFYLYSTRVSSNKVTISGGPYVPIDNIKPEMHKNYIRQAELKIETIRKFTDSYSSQIGAMPSNENEDKADYIQKINNGEITTDFLWENTSKNEANFIIETVLQQLGNINKNEKEFIKEYIERQLLNEITVVDAYQKYYNYIPEEDYKTIVSTIQGNNTILAPDTGVKWVLGLYKKYGKTVIEDLYKLHNDEGDGALDVYLRAKQRRMLPNGKADLNQFKSIAELVVFVREEIDFEEVMGRTKREISNAVHAAAKEAEFPYEDSIWKVVIPKSYEASCYWGQGTEWCTATRENSYWYNTYSKQGPLFININKQTGDKYQFHFESEQFMDKDDFSINEPIFENMGDVTEGLMKFYERRFIDDKEKYFRLKYEIFDDNYYSYKIYRVNNNFYIYSKKYDKFITNEPILDYYIDDHWDYTMIRLELVEGWVFYNSYFDALYEEYKFDAINEFDDEFAYVKKGTQWNVVTWEGELVFDEWYDVIKPYSGSSSDQLVKDGEQFNLYCVKTREFLLSEWVDEIEYDEDIDFLGIAKKDGKTNLIDDHGNFVLPMFVDEVNANAIFDGSEYWLPVKVGEKWNFVGTYCRELGSNIWFDDWSSYRNMYHEYIITAEIDGRKYEVDLYKGYMRDEETWEKIKIANV